MRKLTCSVCNLIELLYLLEEPRIKARSFWEQKLYLTEQRIKKVIFRQLRTCCESHTLIAREIRKRSKRTTVTLFETRVRKLSIAYERLVVATKKWENLANEKGKSHPDTFRAKLEIEHINFVVGQRRRRVSEMFPKASKNKA